MNYADAISNDEAKPRIRMMKYQAGNGIKEEDYKDNRSVIIYELGDKQFHVRLKSDKDFFDKNNISGNIKKIKKSADFSNGNENISAHPLFGKYLKGSTSKRHSRLFPLNENNFNISIKLSDLKNSEDPGKKEIEENNKTVKVLNSQGQAQDMKIAPKIDKLMNEGYETAQLNFTLDPKESSSHKAGHSVNCPSIKRKEKEKDSNNSTLSPHIKANSHYEKDLHELKNIFCKESTLNKKKALFKEGERAKIISELGEIEIETQRKYQPVEEVIFNGLNQCENLGEDHITPAENQSQSQENSYQFTMCFICDRFIPSSQMYHADGCSHAYCKKCGKAFFEDKIEQGDFTFKCPVYKCTKITNMEMIKRFVSEKHFYVTNREEGKLKRSIRNTKTMQQNFIEGMDHFKLYSKKHVIDINSNETFFLFSKTKDQFCIKCSEAALFGKTGNHFVKCLHCFHSICKYCMKTYSPIHLDMSSPAYCRVYYRRNMKNRHQFKKKKCKTFCFTLLIYVASFLALFLACYKFISIGTARATCLKKDSALLLRIVYYFFLIVICVIITPLCLLTVPYFPVLLALVQG